MITSNNALMLDKQSGGGRNCFLDFLKGNLFKKQKKVKVVSH